MVDWAQLWSGKNQENVWRPSLATRSHSENSLTTVSNSHQWSIWGYWNSHCFPDSLLFWYKVISNMENCSCAVFCVSLFQKPLLKWSLLGVSAVMTHCWLTSTLEKMSASQSWHHCAPTSKVTTSVFKCYDSRGREKQQHMTDNCPGPLIDHCSIKHKATAFCEFKTFCVH